MIPNFWPLPITPIFKVQSLLLGILIFRQKSFQFCTPCLKTWQPVLSYCTVITETSVITYHCCILKVVILRMILKNFKIKKIKNHFLTPWLLLLHQNLLWQNFMYIIHLLFWTKHCLCSKDKHHLSLCSKQRS